MKAPRPNNETSRIERLQQYRILDTAPERAFNDIVELASFICRTPIAFLSMVASDRQWFKAVKGVDLEQTPRDDAFCAHTILGSEVLIVEDARKDDRFSGNPLVRGHPGFRFYAGAPLVNPDGHALGTLCVIDETPRELSDDQQKAL